MSASPADTPLTTPASTVATAVFDDCHTASAFTDRLELSESVAIAVNWADAPTNGAVPLSVSPLTPSAEGEEGEAGDEGDEEDGADGADVDGCELLHARDNAMRPEAIRSEARARVTERSLFE